MNVEQRFWNYVTKTKTCWHWTGPIATEGYGQLKIQRKQHMAHRLSYEMVRGPIPSGKVLDHVCRIRHCVNPEHLEIVTQKENIHRGIGVAALNKRKTHCKFGHEFNEINTHIDATNRRICLVCKKITVRTFRLMHHDKVLAYGRKSDAKRRLRRRHSRTSDVID